MPIDIPKVLLDSGGWVFATAVVTGVVTALVRGDLVPGFIYRREVKRADDATALSERLNAVGDNLTAQVATLVTIVGEVLRPRR